MTPRETVEVTHTFPRFRITIFHLVSHALPLAHRSVDCDVLSPTSSSPSPFFLVSKRFLLPFRNLPSTEQKCVAFSVRKECALHRKYMRVHAVSQKNIVSSSS